MTATGMNEILINRTPVLTLWAAVVAERLGFDQNEALSLGQALAGQTAQSKGRRSGIFKPTPKELKQVRQRERGEEFWVELLGRALAAVSTAQGVRSGLRSKPVEPAVFERYLERKFGDALPKARPAMKKLAEAFDSEELATKAFRFYERFRPKLPGGVTGWDAKGELDLDQIQKLAVQPQP